MQPNTNRSTAIVTIETTVPITVHAWDVMIGNVYSQHMEFLSRVPATVAIKFVAAQSVTANQLVVWLDRINRTLVHAGDNIRTQISFAKQDLALQRKGY